MMKFGCLLAQLDGLNPMNPGQPVGKSTGLVFMNLMVILATGLAVGLVLFLCARYFMGKKRHHAHHHHHHHDEHRAGSIPTFTVNEEDQAEESSPDGHRHRRRRRRRDHRPRNPTLGETGGLPPSKTEPSPNSPL